MLLFISLASACLTTGLLGRRDCNFFLSSFFAFLLELSWYHITKRNFQATTDVGHCVLPCKKSLFVLTFPRPSCQNPHVGRDRMCAGESACVNDPRVCVCDVGLYFSSSFPSLPYSTCLVSS